MTTSLSSIQKPDEFSLVDGGSVDSNPIPFDNHTTRIAEKSMDKDMGYHMFS